jgi:hypothetical protein
VEFFRYHNVCAHHANPFDTSPLDGEELLIVRAPYIGVHSASALPYTTRMVEVTVGLPDELSSFLAASGRNLERAALEAIALEAYREDKLTTAQLRRLLGYHTRMQVHGFLKEHGVYLRYGPSDLERDRQAGDAIQAPPAA